MIWWDGRDDFSVHAAVTEGVDVVGATTAAGMGDDATLGGGSGTALLDDASSSS